MYENIGGKIKGLASVLFVVGLIGAIFAGALLLIDEQVALGLLTIIGGPIICWVSSWFLYGFGELIDKASEIARNTSYLKYSPEVKEDQVRKDNSASISKSFKTTGIIDIPKRNKQERD